MSNFASLRVAAAWMLVLGLLAPMLAQAWPPCDGEGMDDNMRCAGLWAAGCCDYSTVKERVRGPGVGDTTAVDVPTVVDQRPVQPGARAHERVPLAVTQAAASRHGPRSVVLRL